MIKDNDITKKLDETDNLLKQGKFVDAIKCLQELHELYPDEESLLLRLAWAFWDNGKKERSIECWEILLDRELQRKVFTGFAFDELVRIYKQRGQIENLVAICEKAAAVQQQDIGLLEELGKAYLLSGRIQQACETFNKLTLMEADNPTFHCRLGEALLASGRNQEFEVSYRQAGILDPAEADRYLFQAADLYLRKGLFHEAKRLLTECLEIAPSNSLYYCSMGDILIALKQLDDAFAAYDQACRYNRSHAAAYYNRLGNSLMRAEHFDGAVKAFETALSFDASAPCRQNLEAALKASGHSQNASA